MVRCAVVGASGYSGAELVRLLAEHPSTEIAAVQADSSSGQRWEDLYPRHGHLFRGRLDPFDLDALAGVDVVFLALPHGSSAAAAATLEGRVGKIIDLSGDLRVADEATYRAWYGHEHPAPQLLGRAVYGLPELFGRELARADLVACAGCYATAVQIAAAPALLLPGSEPAITACAMSGTTGAGRKADLSLSFSEVAGNLRAYGVGRHPHSPEIAAGLNRRTGRTIAVTFVPHLVPIPRGILATVVVRLNDAASAKELGAAYEEAYTDAPFVRVVDPEERLPAVQDVVGTNFCDIAVVMDRTAGTIVVLAVIDNLGKGAAGQAVQIMNLTLGLPETAGLLPEPLRDVGVGQAS